MRSAGGLRLLVPRKIASRDIQRRGKPGVGRRIVLPGGSYKFSIGEKGGGDTLKEEFKGRLSLIPQSG